MGIVHHSLLTVRVRSRFRTWNLTLLSMRLCSASTDRVREDRYMASIMSLDCTAKERASSSTPRLGNRLKMSCKGQPLIKRSTACAGRYADGQRHVVGSHCTQCLDLATGRRCPGRRTTIDADRHTGLQTGTGMLDGIPRPFAVPDCILHTFLT